MLSLENSHNNRYMKPADLNERRSICLAESPIDVLWGGQEESNLRPSGPQSDALTN